MKGRLIFCRLVPVVLWFAASTGQSKTVNVNLHNSNDGETHHAGRGVLGSGTIWTRFVHHWGVNNELANLKDDQGVATTWSIRDESAAPLGTGVNASSPNLVQDVAWGSVNVGANLRFRNLPPSTAFQVALYTFRTPTVGPPSGFTVNGVNRAGVSTDANEPALPGQNGFDYVLFLVNSDGAGEIEIVTSSGSLAGVQLSLYVPPPSAAKVSAIRARIRDLNAKIRRLRRGTVTRSDTLAITRLNKIVRRLRRSL